MSAAYFREMRLSEVVLSIAGILSEFPPKWRERGRNQHRNSFNAVSVLGGVYSGRRWHRPASSFDYPSGRGRSCAEQIWHHEGSRHVACECMRVLWVQVSPQGDHAAEFRHVLRKAWAVDHSRKRIWATPGCKVHFAPIGGPVLCLGGRGIGH